MKELIRLLYLVVVIVPLGLLFIGPLLTLAALRGKQKIGPIVLDPGRRGAAGRFGALLLGILVWLAVWGGLAIILSGARPPAIGDPTNERLQAQITPTAPAVITTSTSTPTSLPSATPVPPVTPTPQAEVPTPSPSPAPSPSPSPSPLPPTPTPALPTATPAPPPATPTPLPTTIVTVSPTLGSTFSPQEETEAIAAVEAANELLHAAVIEPSIGNLAALETLWRGEALAKAQAFAQDLYQRYLRPLDVTFVYLAPPVMRAGNSPGTAFVSSTESWTYTGPIEAHSESFKFTYTLARQDDGWIITDYAYGYASITLPPTEEESLTPIATPATITGTSVITPASQ
jgi:hypothetical protein